MKQVSVADFKASFSDWLDAVRRGERIAIQYGRRKEIVAILSPPPRLGAGSPRRLGALRGKARFALGTGFKMTDAELLEA
jgi:antitoxin (DNA-binding transcriptional repressor) of toxin-antitoxin stability system